MPLLILLRIAPAHRMSWCRGVVVFFAFTAGQWTATHKHDNSIIHENPWDQCKRDIATTQNEVEHVANTCELDSINSIMASLMSYNMLVEDAETAGTDIGTDLNTII